MIFRMIAAVLLAAALPGAARGGGYEDQMRSQLAQSAIVYAEEGGHVAADVHTGLLHQSPEDHVTLSRGKGRHDNATD